MRRRSSGGFTLLELAIVLALISALTAASMPLASRFVRRARATEAVGNLARIYEAECTYNALASERGMTPGFVQAPPTPAAPPSSGRYPADPDAWNASPAWSTLGFTLDRAHYFQYAVDASSKGFTAHARADLDGDGQTSHYTRAARINSEGDLVGGQLESTEDFE